MLNIQDENIKKIAQDNYLENQTRGQFGLSKIARHSHNGLDNLRISESNLEKGIRYAGAFSVDDVGSPTYFVLNSIGNPKTIFLHAIAVYPKAGPYTTKASISGIACLGKSFALSTFSGTPVSAIINPSATFSNFTQSSSYSQFENVAGVWVPYVGAGNTDLTANSRLVFLTDLANNPVVELTITSWNNNSVSFRADLATNWKLTFFLTVI